MENTVRIKISYAIIILSCSALICFGQENKSRRFSMRLGLSPVISFYKVNEKHSSNVHSKPAYCFSAKAEVKVDRHLAVISGAEYLIHGLTFNSYYFGEKHQFLYDNNFIYKYNVQLQELNFPLLIRVIPKAELKKSISSYLSFGYIFRYISSAKLQVEAIKDGVSLFDQQIDFIPEHPYIFKKGSSFLNLAPGIQKNFRESHRALFAELNIRYALTRFSIKESFTASGLYVKHYHIGISLGLKF
jgi:hypothetical protein